MHRRAFMVLLSVACITLRAFAADLPQGYLMFTIEKQPGKTGWISCLLHPRGDFSVYQNDAEPIHGVLSPQETLRILEEFGKLCAAAGEHRFQPIRRFGVQKLRPCFSYKSPEGKKLELEGPENPPPMELTAFMRIMWQKLLFEAAKKPAPPTATVSATAPVPGNIIPPSLR